MIKFRLHAACQTFIEQRMAAAAQAMQAAQESANSDTKSSAGDKYETGREMALKGKRVGEEAVFNGKAVQVLLVM